MAYRFGPSRPVAPLKVQLELWVFRDSLECRVFPVQQAELVVDKKRAVPAVPSESEESLVQDSDSLADSVSTAIRCKDSVPILHSFRCCCHIRCR